MTIQMVQMTFAIVEMKSSLTSTLYSNERTVLSTNLNYIYYSNKSFVSYGNIESLLSSATTSSSNDPLIVSTIAFQFETSSAYTNLPIISAISPRNQNEVFLANKNRVYQVNPSTNYLLAREIGANFEGKSSNVVCNDNLYVNYFGHIIGKSDLVYFRLPTNDNAFTFTSTLFSKSFYMIVPDYINLMLFLGTNTTIYLFDTAKSSVVSQIEDDTIRFIGSVNQNNNQFYSCSKLKDYSTLSLEVFNYTKTLISRVSIANITDTRLTSCDNSVVDLVQGQLFFSTLDISSNKYILSMDLNGNNQQVYNLNWATTTFVNSLNIYRVGKVNRLLVPSNLGSPLNAYTYKSICPNECSGNGDCLSMLCKCNEGYGLSDCSQHYPIISNVSSLPYKRPGYITITGNYFNEGSTIVSIESLPCENLLFIDTKTLQCYFKYDITSAQPSNGYLVAVTVGELTTSSNKFKFLPQSFSNQYYQQNESIMIIGENIMEIQYQNTIRLNELDIKSYCTGNVSQITCKLPSSAVNGDFTIIDYYQNSNKIPIKLTPIITSIQPNSIPTISSTVTINGYFFKCEQLNTINIINGELTSGQVGTITNSTEIIYNTPNRIVKTTKISLSTVNYNSVSPSTNYSYQYPTISSFIQPSDNNGQLRLIGTNFLNPLDSSYLSITFDSTKSLISSVVEFNFEYIELKLPQDFTSTTIKVTINGQSVEKYINLRPIINDILPLPSTSGGSITITGLYLTPSTIYFNQNNKLTSCTFNNGNKVVCSVAGGSGFFTILSESINPNNSSDIVKSLEYKMNYALPIISSVSPQGFFSALSPVSITIGGKNFISTKSLVSVFVNNNIPCNVDSSINNQIICSFISDQLIWPSRIPITISVNLISNTSDSLFYHYIHCPGSPFECSNNGQCDFITGICKCNAGFQLKSDCSVSTTSTSISTGTSNSGGSNSGGSNNSGNTSTSSNTSTGNHDSQTSNNSSSGGSSSTSNPTSSSSPSSSSSTSLSTSSNDYVSSSNIIKYLNSFIAFNILIILIF